MADMQVVLVRHGIAEDREVFARTGEPDSQRPLTDRGARRTRQAAAGLASVLPGPCVVAASPYERARQTADIVASACANAGRPPERATLEAMRPGGDPLEICRWLADQAATDVAILVGHEPDLSDLTAWFTSGRADGFARFKKAAACLVAFPSLPERGGGALHWFLPPAVLRRLAAA